MLEQEQALPNLTPFSVVVGGVGEGMESEREIGGGGDPKHHG